MEQIGEIINEFVRKLNENCRNQISKVHDFKRKSLTNHVEIPLLRASFKHFHSTERGQEMAEQKSFQKFNFMKNLRFVLQVTKLFAIQKLLDQDSFQSTKYVSLLTYLQAYIALAKSKYEVELDFTLNLKKCYLMFNLKKFENKQCLKFRGSSRDG